MASSAHLLGSVGEPAEGDRALKAFLPFLLELWREACKHIELPELLARFGPLLRTRLPGDLLLVRRFDLARSCVETASADSSRPEAPPPPSRNELSPSELDNLLAWSREGDVVRASTREIELRLPGLLPLSVSGDAIVGPLVFDERPTGFLVAIARSGESFNEGHTALVRALLEPFSVALENERRAREDARTREAALADREVLLDRFGRQALDETIIGADSGLRPVMERVDLVAKVDVPILILGETGSGKEVVARAIHTRSRRAGGPFLRVNCGAIPAGLIDSELFGHERGSFTGAVNERKGWFERADQGTLFLDEIGELPLDAQVRLLRVLQDGTLERVGGHRSRSVDVRIVAATHRNLQAMIAERSFREDLWYRIAIFPIHLPPLRERAADIPALASYFAMRAATRFGVSPTLPKQGDFDLLVRYPWPGNVREFASVMERAVILGDGRGLEVARALGPLPDAQTGATASRAAPAPPPERESSSGFASLDQAVARHIEAALARSHGRIEGPFGAAALLGINPHTLRARMRKLGIQWSRFRPGS